MRYSERITDSSKPGKYFLLLIFFSLLFAISAMAQTKEEKKMRLRAIKALDLGKYAEAQMIYIDLLKLDPENVDYNYEMGLAVFEQGINRGLAAPYFAKAIANTKADTLADVFLYAGKAELYASNFDIAIEYFEMYKTIVADPDYESDKTPENVDRYIEMCENGKVQFENSKRYIRLENLGGNINSIYPDYSPVVTNDESVMLFTSRRENTLGGEKDFDDKYYEDIYYSLNIEGKWSEASNVDSTSRYMSAQINTPMHDATITYAGNEDQLFIYRGRDVWVSKLENGLWTVPVKDQGRINSAKGFEPSVFITQDEKTMFVVSDLTTGFGGRDLYVTTKDEFGNWKSLQNLGKKINTKQDEDAPFLTPDGNTLYFASKGHNSAGDYDIFKTVKDDKGEWGIPENLGPPINTPGHDRYFVTTDDGAVGYYSSDRDGGFGDTDIYRIILDCKAVTATTIKGLVYSEDTKNPVFASISVFDPKTNVILKNYKTDKKTGKYEMRLKTEKTYGFKIEAEGYQPHIGEFTVPQQCDYYYLYQEIKIDNLEDSSGRVYAQRAYINNAFFDVDNKVQEQYEDVHPEQLSEEQQDSLRALVTASYNPVEMTNFSKTVDIVDANGTKLSTEVIGDKPVSQVQAKDEFKQSYEEQIALADRYMELGMLPEARARYLIASQIDPDNDYAWQQMNVINKKLDGVPAEALLANVENDPSRMVIPQLMDSAQYQAAVAAGTIAAAEPEPTAPAQVKPQPEVAAATPATQPAVATSEPVTQQPVEQPTMASTEQPKEQPVAANVEQPAVATVEQPAVQQPQAEETVAINEPVTEEPAEQPVAASTTAEKERKLKGEDEQPAVAAGETIVFRNILFDFDKSHLREASKEELNKIYTYMNAKPEVELQIDGHADWIGTIEYNMALSERRAKSAQGYLNEKGVTEERVTYQYFGESVPIAPNANPDGTDNPEGRQLNRRCEFKMDQTGTAQNVVLRF